MARVAVVGPGAIGGVLASMAARGGHDVVLCVRTPFGALTVRDPAGTDHVVDARVLTDPSGADPVDWVLLTTKAQDTASAAPWLRALTAGGPPSAAAPSTVVVAQNGLDHEARVAGLCADGTRVLPATVVLGAEALAPGHVVHHGYGRLTVPDGAGARDLAALLDGGVEVVVTGDFRTAAWRKLLSNAIANPITALTGRRNEVLVDDAVAGLVVALGREVLTVARADGADLGESDLDDLRVHYAGMSPELGTSMLYDRLARRPLEHEFLTGAVVAAGGRLGIATPHHDTLLALLRALP